MRLFTDEQARLKRLIHILDSAIDDAKATVSTRAAEVVNARAALALSEIQHASAERRLKTFEAARGLLAEMAVSVNLLPRPLTAEEK